MLLYVKPKGRKESEIQKIKAEKNIKTDNYTVVTDYSLNKSFREFKINEG
jgi:hypothetical protein